MARVYQCDICGWVIADPYITKMIVFTTDTNKSGSIIKRVRKKMKVFVCGRCRDSIQRVLEKHRKSEKDTSDSPPYTPIRITYGEE